MVKQGFALASAGAAAILLVAALMLWLAGGTGAVSGADEAVGGPFNLIDDGGHAVSERSFPGKFTLVYFGYASCPDVCPATLNTVAAAIGRLGRQADRVQPLFITIDPARDTPAVLRRYVRAFSARLIGLTGSEADIDKVAREYRVVRTSHPIAEGAGAITIDHGAVLYLMAPDGRFVAPIPTDASEMVMAQAIARNM